MSLHGGEDGDNKSMRESGPLFMVYPPIMEGFVWTNKETLFLALFVESLEELVSSSDEEIQLDSITDIICKVLMEFI